MMDDVEIAELALAEAGVEAAAEAQADAVEAQTEAVVEVAKVEAEAKVAIAEAEAEAAVQVAEVAAEVQTVEASRIIAEIDEILECMHRIEDCVKRMEQQGEQEMSEIEALLAMEAVEQAPLAKDETEVKPETASEKAAEAVPASAGTEKAEEKMAEVPPARRKKLWY